MTEVMYCWVIVRLEFEDLLHLKLTIIHWLDLFSLLIHFNQFDQIVKIRVVIKHLNPKLLLLYAQFFKVMFHYLHVIYCYYDFNHQLTLIITTIILNPSILMNLIILIDVYIVLFLSDQYFITFQFLSLPIIPLLRFFDSLILSYLTNPLPKLPISFSLLILILIQSFILLFFPGIKERI